MDDRRRASVARELGLTLEELTDAEAAITPGLGEALMGGLLRFEDALFELSQ